MSCICSVANNKGGVGKTTLSINLASALSILNKKVLLIDLDPQGSLSTYLGFNSTEKYNTVYDVLTNKINIEDSIFMTKDPNIHIICSNIELSLAEVELLSKVGREYLLKNKLKKIRDLYDYIIIDNPPSFGLMQLNSLTASDFLIGVVEPTYLSMKGLDILMGTIEEIREINEDLELMGIVVNMYDSRISHHNEVLDLLKNKYPVFNSIIKRTIRFSDACLDSQSIFEYAGEKFDGSISYMELAKEVVSYEQKI